MSKVHDAIAYAKQHLTDGQHCDDLADQIAARWHVVPESIIRLAEGFEARYYGTDSYKITWYLPNAADTQQAHADAPGDSVISDISVITNNDISNTESVSEELALTPLGDKRRKAVISED